MTISNTIKKIKKSILKKKNILWTFIITFLGLMPSGCMEYGSPSATFILNGTVKSSYDQQPIPNIKVTHYSSGTFTDNSGYFSLTFMNDGDGKLLNYSFQDVDTASNGSFKNKDTIISFEDVTFTGGSGKWDKGTGTKTVDIFLDPK